MLGTSRVAGVVVDGAVPGDIWSSILRRGRMAYRLPSCQEVSANMATTRTGP